MESQGINRPGIQARDALRSWIAIVVVVAFAIGVIAGRALLLPASTASIGSGTAGSAVAVAPATLDGNRDALIQFRAGERSATADERGSLIQLRAGERADTFAERDTLIQFRADERAAQEPGG